MQTNNAVLSYLVDAGWTRSNAQKITGDLIYGGFIIADPEPISEPERIAQAARDWVGSRVGGKDTFDYASGWSTESWETVLDEKIESSDLNKNKNIFAALVILAKEAGVEF